PGIRADLRGQGRRQGPLCGTVTAQLAGVVRCVPVALTVTAVGRLIPDVLEPGSASAVGHAAGGRSQTLPGEQVVMQAEALAGVLHGTRALRGAARQLEHGDDALRASEHGPRARQRLAFEPFDA